MNDMSDLPYAVFSKDGTSKLWVRFSIKGEGQVRKSLGTSDPELARRKAHEVWYEAQYRSRNGLKSQTTSFTKAADEFIAMVEREVERGDRPEYHVRDVPPVIRRYFIEFFGKKDIDAIMERDITRYIEWRKDYWITGPGKDIIEIRYIRDGRSIRRPLGEKRVPSISRQRGELVILRQLFRQAVRWGYLNNAQVPAIEVPRARIPNNRPSFSPEEFRRLEATSLERLSALEIHEHLRWDRTILHAQMMIGAFSGMRPTEMKNLNWGDVLGYRAGRKKALKDRDIRLRVRGKAKSREFVAHEAALSWFDILWTFWLQHQGKEPSDTDPVLATRDGKRLGSTKKGLTELLTKCDLLVDYRGVRRTSYSFRHFYISQQLAHGVDIFALARNTGTSSDMIDKFYGQVTNARMKTHLRPEWTDD
ncbi:integrase [Devosia epidermidihirudinis]|uniref:Integrase n=1 Tax=Devosia epidermidihirudinis TaxID=1293439 RepID=A0A0F5QK93_9HYPH|nr:site-specific integrase [Devosia epidermidihirudinis]KKC41093.1 integrase [Devosia epidermidihirudinis]